MISNADLLFTDKCQNASQNEVGAPSMVRNLNLGNYTVMTLSNMTEQFLHIDVAPLSPHVSVESNNMLNPREHSAASRTVQNLK